MAHKSRNAGDSSPYSVHPGVAMAQNGVTGLKSKDPPVIEVVEDEMAQVLRGKSGAERLHIANQLFSFARELIASSVRAAHPDWDDPRVAAETARRISHGAV